MPGLARALRDEQWEMAALLLVHAVLDTAQRIPRDAIPQLMEALEGEGNGSQE
ncbi:MAG: hypothetical protein O6920_06925 [Chloroflexi bacterium]|nr:hypothetical protein [Chloroflexota bacterium]